MIDAAIGRSVRRPTRMAVREGGRERAHRVRGRRRLPRPRASRCSTAGSRPAAPTRSACTSQAIGHPVVGDAAYGGRRAAIALDRPFLHAGELAFAHPVTGEPVRVEEPLAPELAEVLDRLPSPGLD